MSRTKRNYHHERPITVRYPIWERTYIGIGRDYFAYYDPRHAFINGYDGASPKYYYECTSYPPCGYKENNKGESRKHVKKTFKRSRRRYLHKDTLRELEMHYSE